MIPCPDEAPQCFLKMLRSRVSIRIVKALARRSPDCCYYGVGLYDILSKPIELCRFPEDKPEDLTFFLENLLTGFGAEAATSLPRVETLYLASYYLYLTQRHPSGLHLESIAIQLALEAILDLDDQVLSLAFARLLLWFIEDCSMDKDAEKFFVRLGYAICQSEIVPESKGSSIRELKRYLPPWVKGNIGFLTDDADFPKSWNGLLRRIECGSEVARLFGWVGFNVVKETP